MCSQEGLWLWFSGEILMVDERLDWMILEDFSNLGYLVILNHLYVTLIGTTISHSGVTTYPLWRLFWFDLFDLYAVLLLNFILLTKKNYFLGYQTLSLVKNSEIDPYDFMWKLDIFYRRCYEFFLPPFLKAVQKQILFENTATYPIVDCKIMILLSSQKIRNCSFEIIKNINWREPQSVVFCFFFFIFHFLRSSTVLSLEK